MNRRLYSACAIFVIAAATQCTTEQIMNFDKLEYLKAELEEAPETLTIDATGQALYESHTNAHQPDRPEIGNYETKLDDDELAHLRSRLSSPPIRDQPDHWGKVMPSDHYKRIRVTAGSEKIEKLFGTTAPIAPGARDLLDQLDRVASAVSHYPRETLAIELSQIVVGSSRSATGLLKLSNSGTKTAFCRHPGSMIDAPDGSLVLEVWPDKPTSTLHAADVVTFNVRRVTRVKKADVDEMDARVIKIPSKGSVDFRLEATFPSATAGGYVIRVTYESFVSQLGGRQVIYGQLYSRTIKVAIF